MASLSVKDIYKSYNNKDVISSLSCHINDGEYFVLMGESGCGKSTFLRIIAGLEAPDTGEIFLSGENLTSTPPQERNVSFVFQNYALWPHLKVKDNISFSLDVRKIKGKDKEERVQKIAHLTKIFSELDKYPDELSGGQQQRVSLARGLIYSPTLLLLDEPLSNLDPSLRESMRHELKKIQRELSITTIHVTHDREEALTLADRIGIMKHGQLIQIGTPEELYHEPQSLYVATLLGECNLIQGEVMNSITVKTPLGIFTTKPHKFSGQVSLLVRPKAFLLNREHENCFTADIISQEYFGDQYKFTASKNGITIIGFSPRKISSSTVSLSVLSENVHVVCNNTRELS